MTSKTKKNIQKQQNKHQKQSIAHHWGAQSHLQRTHTHRERGERRENELPAHAHTNHLYCSAHLLKDKASGGGSDRTMPHRSSRSFRKSVLLRSGVMDVCVAALDRELKRIWILCVRVSRLMCAMLLFPKKNCFFALS